MFSSPPVILFVITKVASPCFFSIVPVITVLTVVLEFITPVEGCVGTIVGPDVNS